jgi:hypothetical protein
VLLSRKGVAKFEERLKKKVGVPLKRLLPRFSSTRVPGRLLRFGVPLSRLRLRSRVLSRKPLYSRGSRLDRKVAKESCVSAENAVPWPLKRVSVR